MSCVLIIDLFASPRVSHWSRSRSCGSSWRCSCVVFVLGGFRVRWGRRIHGHRFVGDACPPPLGGPVEPLFGSEVLLQKSFEALPAFECVAHLVFSTLRRGPASWALFGASEGLDVAIIDLLLAGRTRGSRYSRCLRLSLLCVDDLLCVWSRCCHVLRHSCLAGFLRLDLILAVVNMPLIHSIDITLFTPCLSVLIALIFTCFIYLSVSIISILLFEGQLQSSVLINIGNIKSPDDKPFWESTVIQISFMIVLICHIPFIFFAGKESVCIIVDELNRKSISKVLEFKLQIDKKPSQHPEVRISIDLLS